MTNVEKTPYVPNQFGRVPLQVVGAILLYVAALYPLSFFTVGPSVWGFSFVGDQSIPFEFVFVYLVVFGPLMGLSLLAGIASHGSGTIVWLIRDAPQRPAVDLFTIARGVPPTILSVIAVFEIGWVFGNFGGDYFFEHLQQFFTVYLIVAIVGLALEIAARVLVRRHGREKGV